MKLVGEAAPASDAGGSDKAAAPEQETSFADNAGIKAVRDGLVAGFSAEAVDRIMGVVLAEAEKGGLTSTQ